MMLAPKLIDKSRMKARASTQNMSLTDGNSSDLSSRSEYATEMVPIIPYTEIQIDETRLLGSGGYSNVFGGTWGRIEVAIKRLKNKPVPEDTLTSLQKESRKHYGLAHPNIVPLYGIYFGPNQYCLVMAKIPISLMDWLETRPPLALADIHKIGMGVIEALCYIHDEGVIYRDLKSSNVLLDPAQGFHPYLTDFGLSERMDETPIPPSLPRGDSFVVIGSPRWMAPELFRNWPCSPLTDIFSIGVIVWEMFARRIPFPDMENDEIIQRVKRGTREKIPEGTPDDYAKFIRSCAAHNPIKRPQTARLAATFFKQLKPKDGENCLALIQDTQRLIASCPILSVQQFVQTQLAWSKNKALNFMELSPGRQRTLFVFVTALFHFIHDPNEDTYADVAELQPNVRFDLSELERIKSDLPNVSVANATN